MKRFLWVSLALLLVTYTTMGWVLSASYDPWYAWAIVVLGVLLLSLLLSSPWSKIRNGFTRLFQSDTKVFFATVVAAFFGVISIAWLHITAHALIVISVGILFKLDAQIAQLSEAQTFWMLSIVSLTGLGLGGVAQILSHFNP